MMNIPKNNNINIMMMTIRKNIHVHLQRHHHHHQQQQQQQQMFLKRRHTTSIASMILYPTKCKNYNNNKKNTTCRVNQNNVITYTYSSSSSILLPSSNGSSSSSSSSSSSNTDQHKLFLQQINDLNQERQEIFGFDHDDDNSNASTINQEDHVPPFDTINIHNNRRHPTSGNNNDEHNNHDDYDTTVLAPSVPDTPPHHHLQRTKEEMEDIYQEREMIYNFTNEEKLAWGGVINTTSTTTSASTTKRHSPELMNAIQKAREAKAILETEYEQEKQFQLSKIIHENSTTNTSTTNNNNINKNSNDDTIMLQTDNKLFENKNNQIVFTHLNEKGNEISMVDISNKSPTKRIAIARSSVVFPQDVIDAFRIYNKNNDVDEEEDYKNDIIGPKGPIFATARLAGIMGAKRTSDLIPLCHPLPLSKVNIDIKLKKNRVLIECECIVTHKTGVEMEALTGASIAALTIYDMVKAISHDVQIESTYLVGKSGGKRNFDLRDEEAD